MRVGIVGCGNISQAYFDGIKRFMNLELAGCADINMEAAEKKAKENETQAMTVEELLAKADIDIVVNLTIPAVHTEVSLQILEAGKHVHSEKPLAVELVDGKKILQAAEKRGLRVSCAPDTFLGAGLQTCRKLIDDNWIGKPISGTAFMLSKGPESWHPNPFFFYERGAGPMFDLGPYYITALVHLLGPVKRIAGITTTGFSERVAGHEEIRGERIPVETPTHISGVLEFHNGASVTVVMSFDVCAHGHSPIELYGTLGSLKIPDPNTFGGKPQLFTPSSAEWNNVGLTHNYSDNSRGISVADLAASIEQGREHRCSGKLAYHVLEIMHAFEKSSISGKHVELESICERPAPLPQGLLDGFVD
jgi:predicted dehydrogenase